MKTALRISTLICLAVFFGLKATQAQSVTITGPSSLCLSETGIYTAVVMPCCADYYSWSVSGGASIIAGQNEESVAISAAASGNYTLTVLGVISGQSFSASTTVTVSQCTGPEIVSISAATCPDGAVTGCQNVCANSAVTYEVINVPTGATVTWLVTGALSHVENGHTITVEWGGPGNGNLTAFVNGVPSTGLFQINCGIKGISIGIDTPYWGGTAYLNMYGGTAPFVVSVSGPNGYSYSTTTLLNNINIPSSGGLTTIGPYTVTVTDACGTSAQCSFIMPACCSPSFIPIYPITVTQPSDCNACDGTIGNWNNILNGGLPYEFLWSNGETTPDISGLCNGQYDVTITDPYNAMNTLVHHFTLDCMAQSCGTTVSMCVDIIPVPTASLASVPMVNVSNIIEICEGQTVFFENQSIFGATYSWDFGDYTTATTLHTSHKYQTAGTYTVMLIARNECFCSDTTYTTVEVLPSQIPDIQCVGTICVGETVTYSTSSACGNYVWEVIGDGTIEDGGGMSDNFITITWNSGPAGSISLQTPGCSAGCDVANVIPIPILSPSVNIQGKAVVCRGALENYNVADFNGSNITWSVVGSGAIVNGQGTSSVSIQWSDSPDPNPHYVIVEIDNCYLGCSGKDTLLVKILNENYIQGPIELCEGTFSSFAQRDALTNNFLPGNWVIKNEAGDTIKIGTNSTSISVLTSAPPGKYVVTVTPVMNSLNIVCGGPRSLFYTVYPAPPVPLLEGASVICPGEIYSYQVVQPDPNYSYQWGVKDGSPYTIYTGTSINTSWGTTSPRFVQLRQISTSGFQCSSGNNTLQISSVTNLAITGDASVCQETAGIYTATFYEDIKYEWSIVPPDAGTISSGQGTDSLNIFWHRTGPATVSLTLCGITKTFAVDVKPPAIPVVQPPTVCSGSTVQVQTTVPFSTYSWRDVNGTQLSSAAMPQLPNGYFEVEVTNANGCMGDTIFYIGTKPAPQAKIYLEGYLALCPGGPPALMSAVNEASGYDYQWYSNTTPVGSNAPDYSTNMAGTYYVVVTNDVGCTASSNSIILGDCASFGGQCINGYCFFPGDPGDPPPPSTGCNANGNISFNTSSTGKCDEFQFSNTSSNFVPGTLQWRFASSSTLLGSSTETDPSFVFPEMGYYHVLLIGGLYSNPPGDTCYSFEVQTVQVPLGPDFEFSRACPGTAASFKDRSLTMPGASIVSRTWDFGDPASGAANTSTSLAPSHAYANPGDYDVTLTVTAATGCTMSIVKTISVLPLPGASFDQPPVTCEAALVPFVAQLNDYAFSVAWQFGDPTSGTANTSNLGISFHAYQATGTYPVKLTATNVYGCTQVFTQPVIISANNLSGDIAFSQPSPICEGDQIILTAPPGGSSLLWSNGSVGGNITVTQTSISGVTLTDANGCTYSPEPASVNVFGSPSAIIKAVEYNDFGQPINYVENSYTICEGEDVNLVVQGNLNYTYVWSDGSTSTEINFTDDKGNLLPTGSYIFTVTITDGNAGCTSIEGPFQVTVNPLPLIVATSNPSGFLCENNPATLNVVSPQTNVTYVWNTGVFANSIDVLAGGSYFVRAINAFGCEGRSNTLVLHQAPSPSIIPDGCHIQCEGDTVCLPDLAQGIDFQWFFNGVPVPAPEGTVGNFITEQSGQYFVEMTDSFGCSSVSEVLHLDLYEGYGTLNGTVWLDTNGNGIIDAGDSPAPGVSILLNDSLTVIGQVSSNGAGMYMFPDIAAQDYIVALDPASIPPGYQPLLDSLSLTLSGCDVSEQQDWLLVLTCASPTQTLSMNACEGDSIAFNGVFIQAGAQETFVYQNSAGCDSTIIVDVNAWPILPATILQMQGCVGDTVDFNGNYILAGTSQEFIFQNVNGCDSIVIVNVTTFPTEPMTFVEMYACPNDGVSFEGVFIPTDSSAVFTFQNITGCDSLVTVNVSSISEDTSFTNLQGCLGDTIYWNGIAIPVGTSATITLQNISGCDSIVNVNIAAYPDEPMTFVALAGCPGDSVIFNGTFVPTGSSAVFTFQKQNGCDSLVTVNVNAFSADTAIMNLQACDGQSIEFQGETIAAGDTLTFVLENIHGCDSIVTAIVEKMELSDFNLEVDTACHEKQNGALSMMDISGGTPPYLFSLDGVDYQNVPSFNNLSGGSFTVFISNSDGCITEHSVEIPIVPPMVVTVQDATVICGNEVLLIPQVSSAIPYKLQWADGLENEVYPATAPGVYALKVSNACETLDATINLTLEQGDSESPFYIPNAFSPNGDGINDLLFSYFPPSTQVLDFQWKIFDRWGDLLFETSDYKTGWDGIFRGKKLDPGVFVWWVSVKLDACGQVSSIFKKGDVTIVK
ncbi:MAG: PKD domain-containing protein [Bacteroidetes bacterium]|nr:PKD domain-containing protein [Bacteroidota bacterium]